MNPGDAILKPEWHDCKAFGVAWEATRRLVCDPRALPAEAAAALSFARALGALRIVKVDPLQLRDVIRAVDGERVFADSDGKLRLPFDVMLFDLGAGHTPFVTEQLDEGLQLTPIPPSTGNGMGFGYMVTLVDGTHLALETRCWTREAMRVAHAEKDAMTKVGQLAMHQVRAFCYLIRAANVDLAEPVLTRQARRQIARKCQRVPLEIVVKRSSSYSRPRGGSRKYSHAHDRAGNFAHHFEQTRGGKPNTWFEHWERDAPERSIEINGRRCYRIWRPPTVVGIGDGPYVPKVRDARNLTAA